jgi:tetraacyldisaccharide 4'-kinase
MELIVTTEKDAVRFPRPRELDVPVYFLRIEVAILKNREAWDNMLDRLSHPPPALDHILRHREAYRA